MGFGQPPPHAHRLVRAARTTSWSPPVWGSESKNKRNTVAPVWGSGQNRHQLRAISESEPTSGLVKSVLHLRRKSRPCEQPFAAGKQLFILFCYVLISHHDMAVTIEHKNQKKTLNVSSTSFNGFLFVPPPPPRLPPNSHQRSPPLKNLGRQLRGVLGSWAENVDPGFGAKSVP